MIAQIADPGRVALLRLCLVALKSASFEHFDVRIRAEQVEPRTRRLGVRSVRNHCSAVDRERVVLNRYFDDRWDCRFPPGRSPLTSRGRRFLRDAASGKAASDDDVCG